MEHFELKNEATAAGHPVLRRPENLRLHPALEDLQLIDHMGEINEAARLKNQITSEPILVTTNGTILAGFGHWRLAIFEGEAEVRCIEYPFSEDESLHFILAHHQPRRGWNAFTRTRVALTLEPNLQARALDNMRAGGKYKRLANLPKAQRMDVRQAIAQIAGVGARNVSNVKKILQTAHPRLVEALRDGQLSINRAIKMCKLPKARQVEQFTLHHWERANNKVIREVIAHLEATVPSLDAVTLINVLQQQEARQPGSVMVKVTGLERTIVLVGQDLVTSVHYQDNLKLT